MPQQPRRGVRRSPEVAWSHLRLRDCIKPGVRVLFVGINPGVRSAITGHHFAGYSNRFWKLLHDSGLVPEPITYRDDCRLPDWGFGITNLIARPSPGIDSLSRQEYVDGWQTLSAKVQRYRPEFLALVGVTLYRTVDRPQAAALERSVACPWRPAAGCSWRPPLRPAKSQRSKCQLQLRGDAGCVPTVEEGAEMNTATRGSEG